MNLTEEQTNLIREYMHLTIIVSMCKEQLDAIGESRMYAKDLILHMVRLLGRHYSNRLHEVKAELLNHNIATWVDDQGEMVYITVTYRGDKERFGVKRRIVNEEIEKIFRDIKFNPYDPSQFKIRVPGHMAEYVGE